ncbi:hypothetical protein BofuT4_uP112120.1 [Botrytis cinerea T4]|uniref:Uncharacterized protein n=1 Tax=Botryotinia fuckeliana (strain T4) TaxID=999810 RepID=G2Y5U7_BOTF4|nr:hypothetical protein BofuT4_uP112120.1 [Botrytis cinerea T4]
MDVNTSHVGVVEIEIATIRILTGFLVVTPIIKSSTHNWRRTRSVNLNTFSMGTLEREERIAGPDNSGSLRVTPNKMEKSNYPPASKSRKKHIDHWR